jgi:hypothetical protein
MPWSFKRSNSGFIFEAMVGMESLGQDHGHSTAMTAFSLSTGITGQGVPSLHDEVITNQTVIILHTYAKISDCRQHRHLFISQWKWLSSTWGI